MLRLTLSALAAGGCLVTFDDYPVGDASRESALPDAQGGASGDGEASSGSAGSAGSSSGSSGSGGVSSGGSTAGGSSPGGSSTGGSSGTAGRGGSSGTAGVDGGCGDTSSNQRHCGRCNHDCCGGLCVGGKCQPAPIYEAASGDVRPIDVAVNSTSIFFSGTGSATSDAPVRRMVLSSGAVSNVPWNRRTVDGLAADETSVFIAGDNFMTKSGHVERVPIAGGETDPIIVSEDHPSEVNLDAGYVYWRSAQSTISRRVKADSTRAIEPVVTLTGIGSRFAVADGFVYFWGTATSEVFRVGVAGGAPQRLASDQSGIAAIAANAHYVLWSVTSAGVIRRAAAGGSSPTDFVTGQTVPDFVAADADYVYWITLLSPALRARALSGTEPVIDLAPALDGPKKFALDASCIYVPVNGKLLRVAKP